MTKSHAEHSLVVSVRVRSEAAVKAEALREAADDLYGDKGPRHALSTATWLRNRAARMDGGEIMPEVAGESTCAWSTLC